MSLGIASRLGAHRLGRCRAAHVAPTWLGIYAWPSLASLEVTGVSTRSAGYPTRDTPAETGCEKERAGTEGGVGIGAVRGARCCIAW
jgi:hypothetical protein